MTMRLQVCLFPPLLLRRRLHRMWWLPCWAASMPCKYFTLEHFYPQHNLWEHFHRHHHSPYPCFDQQSGFYLFYIISSFKANSTVLINFLVCMIQSVSYAPVYFDLPDLDLWLWWLRRWAMPDNDHSCSRDNNNINCTGHWWNNYNFDEMSEMNWHIDDDHDANLDGKPLMRSWSRLSPGILVIAGGQYAPTIRSVEFWSPSEEGSCQLNDLPYPGLRSGPSLNLVSGQLVTCHFITCEIYSGGGEWNHLADIRDPRDYHSSIVSNNRILLIGGEWDTRSTEWIPMDGSPSQPGPFDVRHGPRHCTIQVSADLIVVTGGGVEWTGGEETLDYVTSYQLTGNGDETSLTPMSQGRYDHACGVYQDAGGKQVRMLLLIKK